MKNEHPRIDSKKRGNLIKKYDLLNFESFDKSVFLSIDEFFDGNNDKASVGANLDKPLPPSTFYAVLKKIKSNTQVIDILVRIGDVMLQENGKMPDDTWMFANCIYIIGNISHDEMEGDAKEIPPSDVGYIFDDQPIF